MKPIEGWDLINEAGEFKKLPAGIYGVKLTSVKDNANDKYFEITCDIVKGEYAGYFKAQVDAGLKDGSKTIRSYTDKALPFFKAFITAVEKTNPGYKWDWDETKLVGKNVVAVFGDEEFEDKNGNVKIGIKLVEFRSLDAWKEGRITVPPLKKLERPEPKTSESANLEQLQMLDDDFPF